jgi:PAS domain S-box-containing protein
MIAENETERNTNYLSDNPDSANAQLTITELRRKNNRALEALRASEQLYRNLIETAPDLICTMDQVGCFSSLNPAFTAMLGWPVEDWLGKPFLLLLHEDDRPRAEKAFADVLQGRRPPVIEVRCITTTGELAHVEITSSPQTQQGRTIGALAIVRNITARKQLEEQFRQAQRLEAVGRLAGGVAHDFNNLLTVILGCSEALIHSLSEDEDECQLAQEIRKAGERAAALTRQLLAFSRKQLIRPVQLDLNDMIRDLEKLLRRLIGEDIELVTLLEPSLGTVHADPGQIEQVLMNLVVNSRDAMPKGGQLIIATSNVELDEPFAKTHGDINPGPYVRIRVKDTGRGISAKNKANLFEPFFTTKAVGKGTGLGLATVYGIVKQSGGAIEVDSEPEKGAAFHVYLPRIAGQPAAKPCESVKAPRGSETVLLVEDDDGVRSLTRTALAANGYTVLEASDGEEALHLQAEFKGTIALLLTDLVLPHMNGIELAERLVRHHPGLKVLYMSGYLDDTLVRHGIWENRQSFLQKPYSPAVLASKVREVLDGPIDSAPAIEASPQAVFLHSLERCNENADFIPLFYQRFMASSPEIAERFRLTDFGKQNQMLLRSLELAASAMQGKGMQELRERAKSHDRYHLIIRPELYECWLEELIATARECDREWNENIESAWRKILGYVIACMQARY